MKAVQIAEAALTVVGLGLVVTGVARWSLSAALIVLGLFLMLAAAWPSGHRR